jgi:hypothetical protein
VSSPQLQPSENHNQPHEMNKPTSQSKQTCHHVFCPVTKFAEMAQHSEAVHCRWTYIHLHSTLITAKLNNPTTSKSPFNTISSAAVSRATIIEPQAPAKIGTTVGATTENSQRPIPDVGSQGT